MVNSSNLSTISAETAPEWDSEFKYSTIYGLSPSTGVFSKMSIVVTNGLDISKCCPGQKGETIIKFQMDEGFLQLKDMKDDQEKSFVQISVFSKNKSINAVYKLKTKMTAYDRMGQIDKTFETCFEQGSNLDPYAIYLSAEALEKNISMELEVVSKAISYNTSVFAKERKGMIGLLSRLSVNLKNDGETITQGPCTNNEEAIIFKTDEASLVVKGCKSEDGNDYFELSVVSDSKNVDVIYQLQLKVRSFDENGVVCRQFQHYCDQGTRLFPYTCFIGEEMKLKRLTVDVEIVHKNIDRLPCFEEGDLHLSFGNGVVLKTYKSVIGSHSGYFKDLIGEEINSPVTINMNDFSVDAMKELFYQVYSTKRPIWTNFKALAMAATSFNFHVILHKIALYLVNYEELAWVDKMKEAISMRLDEAIILLSIQASRNGLWNGMIATGFDPINEFGQQIYINLIKPNLDKGYSQMHHENLLKRCLC